jgi:hypothetical protein
MKHIDKTPYRSETGEINIIDRLQGTLQYGLSWYDRVMAQDTIVAALGKHLGGQYTLLQNIVLPETEIDLPLILIGPPGIYLINAIHEKGVYRARDDEWGTISGDQFAPARINQVKRTVTMGRVLQVYLDRQGYKGLVMADAVLMSANPGLHIDSTRPAVRVVMSDALERFAISITQARVIFSPEAVSELERVILSGKSKIAASASPTSAGEAAPKAASAAPDAGANFLSSVSDQPTSQPISSDSLEFSFSEDAATPEGEYADATMPGEEPKAQTRPEGSQPQGAAKKAAPKARKKGAFSRRQLIIVSVLGLFWLCSMLIFIAYVLYSMGYIALS